MNTDTIKDWIARKTELAAKAYKGPWRLELPHPNDAQCFAVCEENEMAFGSIADCYNFTDEQDKANAVFIADSRTTTPLALEIARLAVEALRKIHNFAHLEHKDYAIKEAEKVLRKIQTLIES